METIQTTKGVLEMEGYVFRDNVPKHLIVTVLPQKCKYTIEAVHPMIQEPIVKFDERNTQQDLDIIMNWYEKAII